MNIEIDKLFAEIGRLHIQVLLLQQELDGLKLKVEPKPEGPIA